MSQATNGNLMKFESVTTDTPIVISTREGQYSLSVRDVQRWIHPTAPPHEAMKFLLTCRMAGVNPFLGEAHLVNLGDRWTTIIDKSGYLKKAQAHPAYDGHQAGIIVQPWDQATKKFTGPPVQIDGAFLPSGHLLRGGWAAVHRNDRAKPFTMTVGVEEYHRNQGTWKTIPCTMIRKVALVQALRESGLISTGWYDPAEVQDEPIGPEYTAVRQPIMPAEELPPTIEVEFSQAIEDASCPPDLLARIEQLRERHGIPADSFLWKEALAKRGVESVAELSAMEAEDLAGRLTSLLPVPIDDPADDPADFTVADCNRVPPKQESRSIYDRLTKHARIRMDERGITPNEVAVILASGRSEPCRDDPNKQIWRLDEFTINEFPDTERLHYVRVVTNENGDVVTVMRATTPESELESEVLSY